MIPKKIHYCWLGGNPLPKSAKKCINSWKKYCPDYEIIEWNESNYDFTKNQYMKEAFEAKEWSFVPDYARLDIIYQHGGIYLDTDVEIIKSFDTLLENKGFAGFESAKHVALGLGFGAEAGNPIIKTLMDSYNGLHFYDVHYASPQLNTMALLNKYELGDSKNIQILEECFTIYPTDYFCPKSMNDGRIRKTKNTYSIHHYSGSWIPEDEMKKWKKSQRRLKYPIIYIYPKKGIRKIMGKKRYEKLKKLLNRG